MLLVNNTLVCAPFLVDVTASLWTVFHSQTFKLWTVFQNLLRGNLQEFRVFTVELELFYKFFSLKAAVASITDSCNWKLTSLKKLHEYCAEKIRPYLYLNVYCILKRYMSQKADRKWTCAVSQDGKAS